MLNCRNNYRLTSIRLTAGIDHMAARGEMSFVKKIGANAGTAKSPPPYSHRRLMARRIIGEKKAALRNRRQ